MENVFDLVNDFYSQDGEWNSVLRQSYVENFLRAKLWQGASEDELFDAWENITIFCIYLGNSGNFLGDMTKDDFIDCLSWCTRNVSGFELTISKAEAFLHTISDLYTHLKRKRIITSDKAPSEAEKILFADNQLHILDSEGNLLPGYEQYGICLTPDLPAKIFLNIGERIDALMQYMYTFFSDKKYHSDLERANFIYSYIKILLGGDSQSEEIIKEEISKNFWNYFFFEYRMIANDKTPIQYFYDVFSETDFRQRDAVNRDILYELLQAEFVFFTVKDKTDEGLYSCINIFTKEDYLLLLPLDESLDIKNMVFTAHIFYNQTMIVDCMQGISLPGRRLTQFMQSMQQAKSLASVRFGGELSWSDFIKRFPIFSRHMAMLRDAFIWSQDIGAKVDLYQNYKPAPLLHDAVAQKIAAFMRKYSFSFYDITLAQQMWSDYLVSSQKDAAGILMPENWAAGVIYAFVQTIGAYLYKPQQIALMCGGVSPQELLRIYEDLNKKLCLTVHDPRYLNEESLFFLLLIK